jgi:hypothetical protein
MTTDGSGVVPMEAVHPAGEQEDQSIDLELLHQCLFVLFSGYIVCGI